MQVNLRKAHTLAEGLRTAAQKVALPTTVLASIYDTVSVQTLLTAAQVKLTAAVEEAVALTTAAFEIRAALGSLNALSGIDDLLAEKAGIDAIEKLLNLVGTSEVAGDPMRIENELNALRENTADRFRRDSVSVVVVDSEIRQAVNSRLSALRLRKIAITDELLVLNMTVKVNLSPATVELLQKLQLV